MTFARLPYRLSRQPSRPLLTLAVLAVVAALPAGCTNEEPERRPADVLTSAKEQLDETSGVRLDLSSDGLPEGVDGLTDAEGVATRAPAFEGEIDLIVAGLAVTVPVVAVDGTVYAMLPFTESFTDIDPAEYGAPDPAALMDPDAGIPSWLVEVDGVTRGEQVRRGEQVLTAYVGTLPGSVVRRTIPGAVASGEFEVTFRVDENDLMHSVVVAGPFYEEGGTVEYVVEFTGYGSERQITRP